jgi:hypothetical protein
VRFGGTQKLKNFCALPAVTILFVIAVGHGSKLVLDAETTAAAARALRVRISKRKAFTV